MCGFTGTISFEKINSQLIDSANEYCICRGPDSLQKATGNEKVNFHLIFNRLKIVDLNNNANQPMHSIKHNSTIMFNGEIYNSKTLREQIGNDYEFRTSHSDTETLFAGLNMYGVDFLDQLEGQFSIFYWDKNSEKIYLIKDRHGQKPLYYSINDKSLTFGSNLKSVYRINENSELNIDEINNYLIYGVNFSPNTIFNQINKIPEGSYIEISYKNRYLESRLVNYWSPSDFIDNKPFNEEEFFEFFHRSVEKRLYSDVPLASFLSGGLDSTSIAKSLFDSGNQLNTFSVVTDNKKINEKKYIDEVVRKYQTKHTEIEVNSNLSNELIFDSINSLDEPYSDPSVVPSFILSKLISAEFKVAISGDGGDELLGGYERMRNHLQNKNKLSENLSKLYKFYPAAFGTGLNIKSKSSDSIESYFSYFKDDKFGSYISNTKFEKTIEPIRLSDNIYKSIMCNEYKYYLSNQMLLKIDRTSMANSLEIRSPFVDHKLVEYVLSHSTPFINSNRPKKILTDYLSSDFETKFLYRKKQGFVFDYKNWIFNNYSDIFDIISSTEVFDLYNIGKVKNFKYLKTRINSLRVWRLFVISNYLLNLNSRSQNT